MIQFDQQIQVIRWFNHQHAATSQDWSGSSQRILLWKPPSSWREIHNPIQSNWCTYKIHTTFNTSPSARSPVSPLGPSTSKSWPVYWAIRVGVFDCWNRHAGNMVREQPSYYHELPFFCWDGLNLKGVHFNVSGPVAVHWFTLLLACGHNTFHSMKHFCCTFVALALCEFIVKPVCLASLCLDWNCIVSWRFHASHILRSLT